MSDEGLPIQWSTRALERVTEAMDYLTRQNPRQVDTWVDGLFDKVAVLATMPGLGRTVPEFNRPDLREVFYQQYRIIYKVKPERIEILTVRHMRQLLDEGDFEVEP